MLIDFFLLLQSSMSSMESQQGLLRKVPIVAASTPAQAASSSAPKTNWTPLKVTAPEAATPSVTDNEVSHLSFILGLSCAVLKIFKKELGADLMNFKMLLFFTSSAALVRNASPPDCARGTAAAQEAPRVFDGGAPAACRPWGITAAGQQPGRPRCVLAAHQQGRKVGDVTVANTVQSVSS